MNAEQEQAGDEAAIRALLAERAGAVRPRDASRFVTSLDPSIVIFDLAPPLRRGGPELLDPSGLQAWRDTWDGEIGYEVAELTISMGGDIAYCHSLDHLTGTRTDGAREDFGPAPPSACARPVTAGRSPTSTRPCRSTWTVPACPRSTCAPNGEGRYRDTSPGMPETCSFPPERTCAATRRGSARWGCCPGRLCPAGGQAACLT